MIGITNVSISGVEAAVRGMRNPLNSWHLSDTVCGEIGPKDLELMKRLALNGDDHGKVLRYITVTLDIVAPLYWWKEFDTYKVGTVANSCSTMHTIHKREFKPEDFSVEYLMPSYEKVFMRTLDALNEAREAYLQTPDKLFWWQMIQLLPSSYNQRRTVLLNYQVLRHMYHARKEHKLNEWRTFCRWIESLEYSELITTMPTMSI